MTERGRIKNLRGAVCGGLTAPIRVVEAFASD